MTFQERPVRLIARLDIKGENLIKGVHLEGLRIIGDPQDFARRYYEQGADEIVYMDIVASLYQRSNLIDIVKKTAFDIFVPLTVGGGVRTVRDVEDLLHAGADKVAINTAAVKRPELISEVAKNFGSQCMVLSVEAKRQDHDKWEVFTDCGREKTGIQVIDWVKQAVEMGAGEILLTSIDQEGTRKGFDIDLLKIVNSISPVPVILSGGYGEPKHLRDAVSYGADGIAFADALHYERLNFSNLREIISDMDVAIRKP